MTTWHESKRKDNIAKHRVDLALAEHFEMDVAMVEEDLTEAYDEQRFRAIGPIDDVLYVYVFAMKRDGTEHAISLRKADPRERRYYAKNV